MVTDIGSREIIKQFLSATDLRTFHFLQLHRIHRALSLGDEEDVFDSLPQLEKIQEVLPSGEMRPISAEASRG